MATVQLFHTCLVNEFYPAVGLAVVRVLERLGFEVDVPSDQTCCGQPAANGGFEAEARVAARHTIEVLESTTGPVVIPSGSCGDMVVHQYGTLFEDDPVWRRRAHDVARRCREFSSFVAEHLDRLPAPERAGEGIPFTYHPSCHLARGLGIDAEPRRVLEAVAGTTARELPAADECCGFGGLFALKHADISARMLERKITNIETSGAARVVSCDLGCLMHIGGGLQRRRSAVTVQHLAELIDEGLR